MSDEPIDAFAQASVTLLHGTIAHGNYCTYCGKHRSQWSSPDEPCDGEEPHAELHAIVPTTEKAVAEFEDEMQRQRPPYSRAVVLTVPELDSLLVAARVMENRGDGATSSILSAMKDRAEWRTPYAKQ
jgi:hypothetical protein